MTKSIIKQAITRSRRVNELEFIDEKEAEKNENPEKLQATEFANISDDELYAELA